MKFMLKTCCFALIIWFVLCCLFPDEALGARSSGAVEAPRGIEQSTATAYCTPDDVAIGEPFTLFLDIVHDSQLRVLLDAPEGGGVEDLFGPSWVVLEPRRVVHLPLNDGSSRALTQVRWRLFGVEPGALEIPVIGADALTSGAVHRIDPSVAMINVRPELAEGEDAARPLAGFQPPPEVDESPLGTISLVIFGSVALLLLTLAVLLVRWMLWRRSAPERATGPTPMAQLAQLDPSDEGAMRELHYSMAQLTRMSLDGRAHRTRAGQTDEQWIQSLRAGGHFSKGIVDRAEQLLTKCAEVKFGASTPTRWAATEAWEEARSICEEAMSTRSATGTANTERETAEAQA